MKPITHTFSHDATNFLLDNQPFHIRSGEMHYFRVPRPYWRDRLLKARAMGLNTICTYMPWNLHELSPGKFDFADMLDVHAFAQLVQELGMWLILRPGPYICAEWDFGGLPAWLLADPGMRIRCMHPAYIEAMNRYVARVGDELASLCCTKGGPIILVQVENEYGSYGNDKDYLRANQKALREGGFDVPLFTSDSSALPNLRAGTLDDCLAVVNFGSKAAEHVANLRKFRPTGPAMCGEFWCGWFDQWGKHRQGNDSPACVDELKWMVQNNVSFNIYMFHGGTNFGFTAGANHYEDYAPTVTGYDYWALLDEAGRPTKKYWATRELLGGDSLPALPEPTPVVPIATIELSESISLFDPLPLPVQGAQPQSAEALGISGGCVLYRTSIEGLGDGKLVFEPHDYALVFLNGKKIATLDRRLRQNTVEIKQTTGPAQLDILVDFTGRTNYGPKMLDRKGIESRVEFSHFVLMNWQMFPIPLRREFISSLKYQISDQHGPAVHRGTLELNEIGDTFLDLRGWRRGCVWVNGHNLGRFWRIGPQQTLYCPGCWLKKGANEIVVFDVESSGRAVVAGVVEPVLDEIE
jgi:beta-galactosidase